MEYFRLSGRRIGRLTARRTRFYGNTQIEGLAATKPVLFSGATFHGRVYAVDAHFMGGVSFLETSFKSEVDFEGVTVGTFIDLAATAPPQQVGTLTVLPDTTVRGETAGWALEGVPERPNTQIEAARVGLAPPGSEH